MRNNRAPGDQVLKQWNHTVLLRLRSIQHDKDKNKSTVFSEWPRYLDEDGYLLVNMFGKIIDSVLKCKITFQVDADFKYLFEKSNEQGKLFDKWEWFCEVFLEYLLSADVKDIYSRQLISSLEEGDCSQGNVVCYFSFWPADTIEVNNKLQRKNVATSLTGDREG